jgi:1-acyl-sn-glycerol-3-phosphate acyltransferase
MRNALRSLWAWSATGVLIFTWLPLLGLVRLTDRDPARYRTGRWFRRLGATVTKANPSWRIQISGERIDNPRRPYVVVSNHQSMADIPIISRLPWEMKWVAKAELFATPIVGWMMRLAGDIEVDRKDRRSRARVLTTARDYLRKRCSVMFFPEGTRSLDGRVLPFSDGAFRLAIRAGVPVLPLALDGSQDALPKHRWRFGEARDIYLKILPPVDTEGLTEEDVGTLRERVRRQIIDQVAAWRGVPPERVDATRDRTREASARAEAKTPT